MKQHRTAGTDFRKIKIDDEEYTLRPLKVGVYAEMESYIVSLRTDPIAEAAKAVDSVPAQHHAAIWAAAMKQATSGKTVTAAEAADFENSIHGLAWKFWRCIEADHPEIDSVQKAIELLTLAGAERLEEIARSVELGSGEADLGNSPGREPTEDPEAAPAGQ